MDRRAHKIGPLLGTGLGIRQFLPVFSLLSGNSGLGNGASAHPDCPHRHFLKLSLPIVPVGSVEPTVSFLFSALRAHGFVPHPHLSFESLAGSSTAVYG